jgi:hypothetical protein
LKGDITERSLMEKFIPDLNQWTSNKVKEFKLLTKENVIKLLNEFQEDTGNYSDWDCMKLCATCLYYMYIQSKLQIFIESIYRGQPNSEEISNAFSQLIDSIYKN